MDFMKEDDVLEVSLGELFYELTHKLWIIILVGIFCGIPVFVSMKFFSTPVYVSTTSVLVGTKSDHLSEEYIALASSNEIAQTAVDSLKLDCSGEELRSRIQVSTQANTRILQISVSDQDPEMAKQIADAVREAVSSKIKSTMDIANIRVVSEANVPQYRVGTPIKKMVLLGALSGAFLTVCVIVVMTVFRNTICTPDEVEKFLGLETLGIIPLETDDINSGKWMDKIKRGIKKS